MGFPFWVRGSIFIKVPERFANKYTRVVVSKRERLLYFKSVKMRGLSSWAPARLPARVLQVCDATASCRVEHLKNERQAELFGNGVPVRLATSEILLFALVIFDILISYPSYKWQIWTWPLKTPLFYLHFGKIYNSKKYHWNESERNICHLLGPCKSTIHIARRGSVTLINRKQFVTRNGYCLLTLQQEFSSHTKSHSLLLCWCIKLRYAENQSNIS